MCLGREGGEGGMVVECFAYSGTVRKVIYYWEPIKKYLADFFPNISDKKLPPLFFYLNGHFWSESTLSSPF